MHTIFVVEVGLAISSFSINNKKRVIRSILNVTHDSWTKVILYLYYLFTAIKDIRATG